MIRLFADGFAGAGIKISGQKTMDFFARMFYSNFKVRAKGLAGIADRLYIETFQ